MVFFVFMGTCSCFDVSRVCGEGSRFFFFWYSCLVFFLLGFFIGLWVFVVKIVFMFIGYFFDGVWVR